MPTKRKKKRNIKILIIVSIILIVLLVVLITAIKKNNTTATTPEQLAKLEAKHQEEIKEQVKKDLYDKPEQERMEYYCASFFKLVDNKSYEKAYELLYDDYKENFFPTLNNFKRYLEENFPSDFALSYLNMERLGDIYVLNVNVKDTVNGVHGHNFDMYVVIKENALNDFVISFSRNSAVVVEEE